MAGRVMAVLLVITAAIAATSAAACSCMAPPGAEWSRSTSRAVFVGEVLAARDSFEEHTEVIHGKSMVIVTSPGTRFAQLRVLRAWKGVRADTVLTVVTTTGGNRFTSGSRYLVYADSISIWSKGLEGWRDSALYAGACSRTRALRDAVVDLKVLGLTASDGDWLMGPGLVRADSLALAPLADSLALHGARSAVQGKKPRRGR